jgi:diketogulonate reductase-like aldo/keto reductase
LAQKPWIVPIPGTTKLHRMTENKGAIVIKLTAKELQEIEMASAQIEVIGIRYTEAMEKSTGFWIFLDYYPTIMPSLQDLKL